MTPLSIDIVIATCERPELLRLCAESIVRVSRHAPMPVRLVVIDNGARETAADALAGLAHASLPILLLREPVSGKSRALNRGLEHVTADLIGYIDDDEQLTDDWFDVVATVFADRDIDFIGGPYVAQLPSAPPSWLPRTFSAVLGDVKGPPTRTAYGAAGGPGLLGGNAVVRRELQDRVGGFNVDLGPSASHRQRTGEDHEMLLRYLATGAKGYFVPELKILHHVPESRLHKGYFRRFALEHGRAQALLDHDRPEAVARVLSIPRYMLRETLESLVRLGSRNPSTQFAAELQLRECAGFVVERFRLLRARA